MVPTIDSTRTIERLLRATVSGDSMLPILHDGDAVYVSVTREPRVGDIVVLRAATAFVVHRVIACGQWLVTRGDSCGLPDPAFDRDQLMGVVVRFERGEMTRRLDTRLQRFGARVAGRLSRWSTPARGWRRVVAKCVRIVFRVWLDMFAGSAAHKRSAVD